MLTDNNIRKKIKKQVEVSDSEEDRLSNLPEGIITYILSFLSTKESIRTSILSTRWKYIWSSVPTLDLRHSDFIKAKSWGMYLTHKEARDTCMNFLDRVLMGHSVHNLENVYIDGSERAPHDGSHIESWICAAIKRKVRKLHLLNLFAKQPYELHQSWFTCNALVDLKLDVDLVINFPTTSPSFPNLKRLELDAVVFKDDTSAQNLILSCPVLEDLVIWREDYDNLQTLNITSRPLKKLVLKDATEYYNRPGQRIVIDAPSLESLDIEATYEYVVRDLSSIITAKLHVPYENSVDSESIGTCLCACIKWIFNVKFLQLSCCTMDHLSLANSCNLPAFHNLTYLEFFSVDFYCSLKWKWMMEFLNSSPILEVLTFDGFLFSGREKGTSLEWDVVPNCFVSHLKTIKIEGGISEENTKKARYFLKNAKVLEKLIIEKYKYEDFKNSKIDWEDILKHRRGSITWSDQELVISFV